VELHNVPGNPKPVNTFLVPGTQSINPPSRYPGQAAGRDDLADRPCNRAWPHCCVILDVATDPESVLMARIDFPPLTITVLHVDGLPPSV